MINSQKVIALRIDSARVKELIDELSAQADIRKDIEELYTLPRNGGVKHTTLVASVLY